MDLILLNSYSIMKNFLSLFNDKNILNKGNHLQWIENIKHDFLELIRLGKINNDYSNILGHSIKLLQIILSSILLRKRDEKSYDNNQNIKDNFLIQHWEFISLIVKLIQEILNSFGNEFNSNQKIQINPTNMEKITKLKEFIEEINWKIKILQSITPNFKSHHENDEYIGIMNWILSSPSTLLTMSLREKKYINSEDIIQHYHLTNLDNCLLMEIASNTKLIQSIIDIISKLKDQNEHKINDVINEIGILIIMLLLNLFF